MFGSLRFRTRISLLVAIATIALLTVTAVTQVLGRRSEREVSGVETRYLPLIELDHQLKTSFAAIPRALKNAADAAEDSGLKDADVLMQQFTEQLAAGEQTLADNGGDERALLAEVRAYYATARPVSAAIVGGTPPETLAAKVDAMLKAQAAFEAHLDAATTPDRTRAAAAFATARDAQRTALVVDIGAATGAVVLMVLLSWQIIRRTVRSLTAVSDGMERVARGEFGRDIEVTTRDELGALASQANQTAARLRDYRASGEREDWIKTGLGALGDEIAGDLDPTALGRAAMRFLAKYIGAEVAVVYGGDEAGVFHLLDTYGTAGEPPASFKLGESVLGQAAADDAVRALAELPADYLTVRSALGKAAPRSVLIVPFTHERRPMGLLELGLLADDAGGRAVELLTRARASLGSAFRMAESRQRTRALLDETKRQAEELQLAADELRTTNGELARASRYKSEFLANMSHELRTPLNSVMILSKILANNEAGNLTDKQAEFATMIHRSGDELLALINDVLDMAKVEAGKQDMVYERLRVVDLFDYTRRMFEPQAMQKGLTFDVAIADDVPGEIQTDRARLSQILKNLIANAFKFTPRGGEVRVRVGKFVPAQLPRLTVSGARDAIAITVSDTGIGIPVDKQAWIFEAFAQAEGGTSRKYGGTGLGLTIAKQLAVRLGGDLGVDSEVGKGSRFHVVLPIEGAAHEAEARAVASPSPRASERALTPAPGVRAALPTIADDRAALAAGEPCLLVIEDDPEFATVVRDLVREAGFKCLVASEGRPGLALATEHVPSGIVLDVGLPDLDGWSVMELLKAERVTRDIPVHFVTASATDGAERAHRMGAVGFMAKPVAAMQLRSALRALEEAGRAGVRKVLLVESDATLRASMQAMLVGSEFVVDAVATPGEAAARIASTTYGCIIANLALPDPAAGFELLARIRAVPRTAHVPVVVHTAATPTVGELRALEEDPRVIVVIDGERSNERVLEETRLFVHRVRTALPERARGATPPAGAETLLDGKTVLVVDDDMRNVYSLSSALRAKNLRVLTATDGQEALDELAQHPETSAVLMDIMMPRMDGHEATRRIRAQDQFRELPIIALTAKTMNGEREKCLEAGASDYVPKPVDVDRLVSLLRRWLGERAGSDAGATRAP